MICKTMALQSWHTTIRDPFNFSVLSSSFFPKFLLRYKNSNLALFKSSCVADYVCLCIGSSFIELILHEYAQCVSIPCNM